jgi:hypothetical protein
MMVPHCPLSGGGPGWCTGAGSGSRSHQQWPGRGGCRRCCPAVPAADAFLGYAGKDVPNSYHYPYPARSRHRTRTSRRMRKHRELEHVRHFARSNVMFAWSLYMCLIISAWHNVVSSLQDEDENEIQEQVGEVGAWTHCSNRAISDVALPATRNPAVRSEPATRRCACRLFRLS